MTQKLVSAEIPRRVLYRVEEAVLLLGLSRSQLYELIRSGRLQTVTEGRVRPILAASVDAYLSLLTIEVKAAGGGDAVQLGTPYASPTLHPSPSRADVVVQAE